MSRTTEIEWTEHTWNPFVGCSINTDGCKNCYAMRQAYRIEQFGTTQVYNGLTRKTKQDRIVWTGKLAKSSNATFSKPAKLKQPSLIFVNSMSDFFHENARLEWQLEAIELMKATPRHTYQILTKRPENIAKIAAKIGHFPDNVWLGVTLESKKLANRIDLLRPIPAKIKFLSIEPILSDISLNYSGIDWIIVGGESGPQCRSVSPEWVYDIRDACVQQDTPLFFKQWGHYKNNPLPNAKTIDTYGKGGSLVEGTLWKQYPKWFRDGGYVKQILK